jgi:pimeloyl-ACP methyl ester carboxylesterase
MATYVLVHGAWGGSYGWRKVRPMLQAAGHDVFTPSLTGLGERSHLASPAVNLSTHIEDVCNCIHCEDLSDIVLVGYSYGGMVVTGVVDRNSDRVSHLVYLDAFVPNDGQALYTINAPGGTVPTPPPLTDTDDWLIPPMSRHFDDLAEQAWNDARRVAHPKGCFTEPVRLRKPLEDHAFSLTYIKATADARPAEGPQGFWTFADRTRNNPRWRYREVDCDHMVPQKKPAELTDLFLEVLR